VAVGEHKEGLTLPFVTHIVINW